MQRSKGLTNYHTCRSLRDIDLDNVPRYSLTKQKLGTGQCPESRSARSTRSVANPRKTGACFWNFSTESVTKNR